MDGSVYVGMYICTNALLTVEWTGCARELGIVMESGQGNSNKRQRNVSSQYTQELP